MLRVIIRGGGDLASGIAVRLYRSGIKVIITEIRQPLAVRRFVSFAEAVYKQDVSVEDIPGRLVANKKSIEKCLSDGGIPVVIDEELNLISQIEISAIIDARMLKQKTIICAIDIPLKIGIGPGFFPGENCDCVIETKRGPYLGRVFWNNPAESDSGVPEKVAEFENERVLRAPEAGVFKTCVSIGDVLEKGDLMATINTSVIRAPFRGVVRGLLHDGLEVFSGLKVGDLDPRCDPLLCTLVSDKALAIGGGVLEAILSKNELREMLGSGK